MASAAAPAWHSIDPGAWFRDFLREELAPYPGRNAHVFRMVLSSSLIIVVCMTFQIPDAWQGAIYALLISRESTRATFETVAIFIFVTAIGAAFILVQAYFVASLPDQHLFFVIVSLFVSFYVTSVLTSYTAAVAFANVLAVGIPLWDRHVSAETNLEDTLWLCLSVAVAAAITAIVELVFAKERPGQEVISSITKRLAAVEKLLSCYAENCTADPTSVEHIVNLAMRGTSALRGGLRHSDYSQEYSIPMAAVAALSGRLVDIAAALTKANVQPRSEDQPRFRRLALAISRVGEDLTSHRIPQPVQFTTDENSAAVSPLLREMEETVSLMPQAFTASGSLSYLPSPDELPQPGLLVPDAFTNPAHLRFALKGCLAASTCYMIYMLVDWPAISTAVTTCMLTALSTIGSSRQKQMLRVAGAIVGGFILGMGSQIFILPHLDSIGSFVILCALVTTIAAWIMTSTPRLSYFGVQLVLAFYLINLSEFTMQTSLAVARDRVMGILLGLFVMWLVFDKFWSQPAGVAMKKAFISTLRVMAQFVKEPAGKDRRSAMLRNIALRETISADLDNVRQVADGVLFEFGPSRVADLALRDRIRQWQPQLRMIFLIRIVLWRYRLRLPGFELPESIEPAQQEFDDRVGAVLEGIADRMEGHQPAPKPDLEAAYTRLQRSASTFSPVQQQLAAKIQSFLVLSRQLVGLAQSLDRET